MHLIYSQALSSARAYCRNFCAPLMCTRKKGHSWLSPWNDPCRIRKGLARGCSGRERGHPRTAWLRAGRMRRSGVRRRAGTSAARECAARSWFRPFACRVGTGGVSMTATTVAPELCSRKEFFGGEYFFVRAPDCRPALSARRCRARHLGPVPVDVGQRAQPRAPDAARRSCGGEAGRGRCGLRSRRDVLTRVGRCTAGPGARDGHHGAR